MDVAAAVWHCGLADPHAVIGASQEKAIGQAAHVAAAQARRMQSRLRLHELWKEYLEVLGHTSADHWLLVTGYHDSSFSTWPWLAWWVR